MPVSTGEHGRAKGGRGSTLHNAPGAATAISGPHFNERPGPKAQHGCPFTPGKRMTLRHIGRPLGRTCRAHEGPVQPNSNQSLANRR